MMGDVAPLPDTTQPILGRDRELALLADLLGLAGEPRSRSVLLVGDAGVGKTRLLRELVARADAAGWRTLVGHCLDFGDSALPYLPFSELFGRLAIDRPEAIAELTADRPVLSHLQPGRRLISGATAEAVENLERSDLFDAIHGAFDDLSEERPVLVVIEDVHWADRSTRDLLSFLFARAVPRARRRARVLPHRRPAPAPPAACDRRPVGPRRPACTGSRSTRCPTPTYAAWCARCCRARCPRATCTRSSAAPRATRSSPRSWSAPAEGAHGAGLPDDLADLLLVRLDRLDDDARAVVRAAACSGRRVEPRPARGRRRPARRRPRGRPARRRRAEHPGPGRHRQLRLPARAAGRGGLRRPAARRAGAAARGVRRGARLSTASTARPPSSPGTPGWPTTRRPRCAPASRPATRRCRSAVPTRRPGTSRPRSSWSPTRGVAADARPGRPGGQGRRRADGLRPPRARRQAGAAASSATCPQTRPPTTGRVC